MTRNTESKSRSLDTPAAWSTPKASDGTGGRSSKTLGGGNAHLQIEARLTHWPTPNAGPQNDGDTTWQERRTMLKEKHGNGNGFGMTLGQATQLSTWATPTNRDHKHAGTTSYRDRGGGRRKAKP